MTITIRIATGNAAFADGNKACEVSHIIREQVAEWIERENPSRGDVHPLRDGNGNNVGSAQVTS